MIKLFARHQVADFGQWREAYTNFSSLREKYGVRADEVFQGTEDPNDVTVTHDFDSLEASQAFMASEEIRDAIGKTGVVGAPSIWTTTAA